MKKLLILLLVVVVALGALTSCEDILSKIPGLGGDDHVCESPCERCGKCTDLECESKACSNKCYGHIIPPAAHKCESACPECGKCTDTSCSNTVCKEKCAGHTASGDSWEENYDIITVAEAIDIATAAGQNGTEDRYYIAGTVVTVSNASYGEMTVADETGEIYVYGTYSADGELKFPELESRPVAGDKVLLHCILSTYNDAPQVKNARLIDFEHVEVEIDPSEYPAATIAEARAAKTGDKVRVTGVVARITYANGHVPSGVILVDGADSIYVYDNDIAGQVSIGNKIEVAAFKTYWVLESEQGNAEKFGYKGCNQLENAVLVSNDKGNNTWINDSIPTATVKELMDTSVTEDITTQVYKVNALVKKAPGNGFINYYIDDLDGTTGSYVYTQCNGSDFAWLDQFDGKICTVYMVLLNAKSSSTGCAWRLLPLEVVNEGYTFDVNDAPEFAVEYHGVGQFLSQYKGNPELELVTSVSSELLGFEGVTLSYTSDNEDVVYFTTVDGKTIFNCGANGTANVTVTATHGNNTHSQTISIAVVPNAEYDTISIADAVAKEVGEEVYVRGIVGPSLVNQVGFYLFDESGMVAIRLSDESYFEGLAIGQEVVIKGKRDMWHKEGADFGQTVISNASIEANYYGNQPYNTDFFITDKTLEDFYNLDELVDSTTDVYVLKATITVEETKYYTNIYLTSGDITVRLYCSSANQYNWLKAFAGQEVTVEVAPCNWNSKNYYTGCVLAVVLEDGTKVYNTLNFN